MKMRFAKYIAVAAILITVAACNSDEDKDLTSTIQANSVAVTAFNIKANPKVLDNLDSVFFSIDLEKAEIYNADSLPKGTNVSHLLVNIKTPTVKVCRLTFRRAGSDNDTTVNYLSSQKDSIDFSQGPAKLEIVSEDGALTRTYTVRVNVHRSEPDSLYWNQAYKRSLPTNLTNVAVQRTIEHNGKIFCLTENAAGTHCLAQTSHPLDTWQYTAVQLPAAAQVRELTSWGDKLAILDQSGMIWTSEDEGKTWLAEGHNAHHIYGDYDGRLLCSAQEADGWKILTLPEGDKLSLPEGMPVSGTSQMLVYSTKWAPNPMGLMVGGKTADGKMTNTVWAFDGNQCAKINVNNELPAVSGMTVVPYSTYKNNNIWQVTEETALLAFGGIQSGGVFLNRTVYISVDRGIHWQTANRLLQQPGYIPAFYDADGLVVSSDMSIPQVWQSQPDAKLPPWLYIEEPSRVSAPITTWECPAIYLFGGVNNQEETFDTVWRGVINRLTFRPIY